MSDERQITAFVCESCGSVWPSETNPPTLCHHGRLPEDERPEPHPRTEMVLVEASALSQAREEIGRLERAYDRLTLEYHDARNELLAALSEAREEIERLIHESTESHERLEKIVARLSGENARLQDECLQLYEALTIAKAYVPMQGDHVDKDIVLEAKAAFERSRMGVRDEEQEKR